MQDPEEVASPNPVYHFLFFTPPGEYNRKKPAICYNLVLRRESGQGFSPDSSSGYGAGFLAEHRWVSII
jgi:hypothetical protein